MPHFYSPIFYCETDIMKLIIKLFPEIIVKSRPVRQRMIKQLRTNLRRVLKALCENENEKIEVAGSWDRLTIELQNMDANKEQLAIETIKNTPGIHHILRVESFSFTDLEDILQQCIPVYTKMLDGKTFCVRAKRSGKHNFTSHELEQKVGGGLLHNTPAKGVKLKDPEITVKLEIKDQTFYVITERYPGLGGFPLGMQDKCLSLISGGYDSTVSSYLMIKRGICTHYCFFNLGGIAHEVGVKQVSHYIWKKYASSQRVRFYSVPFQQVVAEILKNVNHAMMGVVLKRMMLKAAEKIALENGIPALVTGEAVAQVSSQTLTNLSVIDEATSQLVLRPLATTDKEDIIATARKIGTEEFARVMPEYCGVISDRPTTAAKLDKVKHEEAKMDMSVLQQAVDDVQITSIDKVLDSIKSIHDIELKSIPDIDDIVVDIRHPDEQEKAPLFLTNNSIIRLPFYELARKFPALDPEKNYLLYCNKGIMSELQAQELIEQGCENVQVYRPG